MQSNTLEVAKRACEFARNGLRYGSDNLRDQSSKLQNPQTSARTQAVRNLATSMFNGRNGFDDTNPDHLAVFVSQIVTHGHMQAGNCGELSQVAFVYLYKYNVRPAEILQVTNPDGADHTFVVIGRKAHKNDVIGMGQRGINPNSHISPIKLKNAIVVDPWVDLVCYGREYPVKFCKRVKQLINSFEMDDYLAYSSLYQAWGGTYTSVRIGCRCSA